MKAEERRKAASVGQVDPGPSPGIPSDVDYSGRVNLHIVLCFTRYSHVNKTKRAMKRKHT